MNTGQPSARRQPTAAEVDMCLGVVARALFLSEPQPVGRPSLAEFVCSPANRYKDLKDLGVDSFAWMALLTHLEDQLSIEFPDELMMSDTLTPQDVARAVAELLRSDRSGEGASDAPPPRKSVSSGERYLIVDDFLPPEELDHLRTNMRMAEFRRIDSVVDPAMDGAAYRSDGKMLDYDAFLAPGDPGDPFHSILRAVCNNPALYGEAGEDWSILSFAFWEYPVGTRLGWHNDAGRGRAGEFILYLHDEWKPSWGGELMLLDRDADEEFIQDTDANPFKRVEAAVARAQVELMAIVPRPNRLVLVQAGTPHCINRVDVSAGNARRRSLTGFAARREAKRTEHQSKLSQLGSLMGWRLETQKGLEPRTPATDSPERSWEQ